MSNAVRAASILLLAAAISPAQAETVSQLYQRHNLVGTFAPDCSRPPARDNRHIVTKILNANQVQRQQFVGPGQLEATVIIMHAAEEPGGHISVGGMNNNNQPVAQLVRVEGNRVRVMQAMLAGKPTISDGRFLETNSDIRWFNKCR